MLQLVKNNYLEDAKMVTHMVEQFCASSNVQDYIHLNEYFIQETDYLLGNQINNGKKPKSFMKQAVSKILPFGDTTNSLNVPTLRHQINIKAKILTNQTPEDQFQNIHNSMVYNAVNDNMSQHSQFNQSFYSRSPDRKNGQSTIKKIQKMVSHQKMTGPRKN